MNVLPHDLAMLASRERSGSAAANAGANKFDRDAKNPADQPAARQAWMREMERAQLAGWFQPASTNHTEAGQWANASPRSNSSGSGPSHHTSKDRQAISAEERSAVMSHSEGRPVAARTAEGTLATASAHLRGRAGQSMPAALRGAGEASLLRAANTPYGNPPLALGSQLHGALPETGAALSNEPPPSAPDPDAYVPGTRGAHAETLGAVAGDGAARVSARWQKDGLLVWLGINGTAGQVEAQAGAVVSTLYRTMQMHDQRLSRVVCNGRVVFEAATDAPPAEPDSFSAVTGRMSAHNLSAAASTHFIPKGIS